ncbi:MAG: M24 family metallopeptidase [Desulfohalobiaceae bacterium]|nr:M24 family metallopeptidase [Desulfohalobiaceae bacterium]
MTVFTKEEYLQRLKRTKSRMMEQDLEVIVLADPANMNYLTGYDGWSFYTPQVLLVSVYEDEPQLIVRGMDVNGAGHTVWLSADSCQGYPDSLVQVADKHPMNFVGDFIRKKGWSDKRIGVEKDAYYFNVRCLEELQKTLPHVRFEDCSLLVNWVRSIKSQAEILFMQEAGKIAEKAMQTALDNIAPGVRECDCVAEVYRAQIQGLPEFGGDYPAIVPMMPTGSKTSAPHLTWTDEPYQREQPVNLELSGCRHRYHAPLARTAWVGQNPPQKLQDLAQNTVDGLNLTLGAIKPGVTCEEVELVWRQHIARLGLEKKSRIAYALGLNYPPDWGEHTMSFRPGDTTVLRPNMTFHMILGMWMDDYGFECSESFWITDEGCATFSDFPRKLFMVG